MCYTVGDQYAHHQTTFHPADMRYVSTCTTRQMPSLQRASSRSADSYTYSDRTFYETNTATSYVESRESSQTDYGTSEYASAPATGPSTSYVMPSDEYGGSRHNSTMSSSADCHSGTEGGGVSPMHCPTDLRSPQVWPVTHFFRVSFL